MAETFAGNTERMQPSQLVVGPLAGYTVGLTTGNPQNIQNQLLSDSGAVCITAPMTTQSAVDSTRLEVATLGINADETDFVLLTSAHGVERWIQTCDSLGLGPLLRDLLSNVPLLVVGPDTAGSLVTEGFSPFLVSPSHDVRELTEAIAASEIENPRVVVQLDGFGSADLCAELRTHTDHVAEIPVYRTVDSSNADSAERLLSAVRDRQVHGLTFICPDDVNSFFDLVDKREMVETIGAALASDVEVFCIDDATKTALAEWSSATPHVPQRSGIGDLVLLVANRLRALSTDFFLAGIAVRLQGMMAVLDHETVVMLTARERSLLQVLLGRPGVVYSKQALLRLVWEGSATDPHAVEVAIARLRRTLGPAGGGIETIVRRGYRVRTEL